MSLFLSKVISSIVELILFLIVPFLWWLLTARKETGFAQWIGLKKTKGKTSQLTLWIIAISAGFLLVSVLVLSLLKTTTMATSEFAGLGIRALPSILVYAILNTSLPEELLFRGFLLKRLMIRFGFPVANLVQALIFGFLHGAMFFSTVGAQKAILIILFTGIIACLMGYTNEKKADGSIIPGWIMHATANIFSGICAAFLFF